MFLKRLIEMNKLSKLYMIISTVLGALAFAETAVASGALPAWVGTATYTGQAAIEDFDTYDFGAGIALIVTNSDNSFTGYYQTMVSTHSLGGTGLTVPNLNVSGSGAGFELTLVAQFLGSFTSLAGGSTSFNVTSGTADLFFDNSPDYSFSLDSGFNDGDSILSGLITAGSGFLLGSAGIGVEDFELDFSGAFGFDPTVYSPNIGGGSALFSIKTKTLLNNTPIIDTVLAGNQTVMNRSVIGNNKILAEADGSLQLTTVPVPAGIWLFSSALLCLVSVGVRRKANI